MPDLSDYNADGSKSESFLKKKAKEENVATVDWSDVLLEEKDFLDFMDENRVKDGPGPGDKFALAFSGGGLRAAAFQSGVLWQLAKRDRLKDVTYFIAVSGGGYIASSFASHCAGRPAPEKGKVKEWYLQVVADCVTRMQENAGNFVRDCVAKPCQSDKTASPDKGCAPWPRIFDLPLLLIALFMTLALHPVMYLTLFLVPMTVFVEIFFGPGMRAAFCYLGSDSFQQVPVILWNLTPINYAVSAVGVTVAASIVFSIMSAVCCKPPKPPDRKTRDRDDPSLGYQVGHAVTSLLVRLSVIFLVITAVVGITVGAQIVSYQNQDERRHHCSSYVSCQKLLPVDNATCVDYFRNGTVFNDDGAIEQMSLRAWWSTPDEPDEAVGCNDVYHEATDTGRTKNIFSIICLGLLGITLSMCIFLPCFGVDNIVLVAAWAGPVLVLASTVAVMQYAIFGPVTGNAHGVMGAFDEATWRSMVSRCLFLNLPILIMYEELRATLHYYYKHCLQKNFFMNGSDVRIGELAKDFFHRNKAEEPAYEYYKYGAEDGKLSGSSYCPLLMVTATSSDYESPGDSDKIAEISISPLHTGGEETHYVRTPRSRSLAKCTALTGAGCLDAITLSMQSDKLYLRFWFEALNLSWGDYLFHNTMKSHLNNMAEKIFDKMPGGWEIEDFIIRLVHRVAGGFLWFIAFGFILIGWWDMMGDHSFFVGYLNKDSCEEAALLFRVAGCLALVMVSTAFLSFVPICNILSLSSISRLLLQLTMYKFVGKYPPRLLYCTDGGVQDCTGLVQMMRRQLPKIFLVLAGADPTDELIILKMAINCAEKERVGSFYDPNNPKRDFRLILEEYQEELQGGHQNSGSVMHIKICYGYRDTWGKALGKKEPKYGDLFIIKNRLPVEGVSAIQPPITAGEVKTGVVTNKVPDWAKDKHNYDLGPFGCCDACHACCNIGPKFPHGTFTGYLYLSPTWFSSLSRLGFALSDKGLDEMDRQSA